jgi:hypothetical protein
MSINNVGIFASQISGHLWEPAGAYDALATVTVPSGGLTSVTFAGIPAGYKHLQLRWTGRSSRSANSDTLTIIFNGDSAANYSYHDLFGDGSTTGAQGAANTSTMYSGWVAGASAGANTQGVGVLDVLDYANTSKFKTVKSLTGYDNNGSGLISLESNSWRSTTAVTSLTITTQFSGTFQQYSQFALYGVK